MLPATAPRPERPLLPSALQDDAVDDDDVALAPSRRLNGHRAAPAVSNGNISSRPLASYGEDEILLLAKYANEARIDPELRADPSRASAVTMMPAGPLPPPDSAGALAGPSVSPRIASALHGNDAAGDVRKSKRELSQSKRAAQNRAAQVSHHTVAHALHWNRWSSSSSLERLREDLGQQLPIFSSPWLRTTNQLGRDCAKQVWHSLAFGGIFGRSARH
jgi:hypothetical protein